jgi:hypothetical protein
MCGNPLESIGGTAGKLLRNGAKAAYNPLGAAKDAARDAGLLPESRATQRAAAEASAAASRNAADAEAASLAGMRIRAQRKAMRENSLLTGAGAGRASLGV